MQSPSTTFTTRDTWNSSAQTDAATAFESTLQESAIRYTRNKLLPCHTHRSSTADLRSDRIQRIRDGHSLSSQDNTAFQQFCTTYGHSPTWITHVKWNEHSYPICFSNDGSQILGSQDVTINDITKNHRKHALSVLQLLGLDAPRIARCRVEHTCEGVVYHRFTGTIDEESFTLDILPDGSHFRLSRHTSSSNGERSSIMEFDVSSLTDEKRSRYTSYLSKTCHAFREYRTLTIHQAYELTNPKCGRTRVAILFSFDAQKEKYLLTCTPSGAWAQIFYQGRSVYSKLPSRM